MGHHHNHDHTHGANKRTLTIAFFIIFAFMILEVIGGVLTNSLALLSDAGHMFSDAVSLGVGVLAFTLGERVADYSKTYGYKRFEILAAVFNGVTLIVIAVFIVIESIERFTNPPEIATTGMLVIAIIGLLVNILVAWILMRGGDTEHNLNVRAAFLHVLGDLLGSVGAVVASLLILLFGFGWADPLASVIVALIITVSGVRVTKEAIHVLMEGTPKNIDIQKVIDLLKGTQHVVDIHDLHVWSITSGHNALSCHVVVKEGVTFEECQKLLKIIEHDLLHLNIGHSTIQIENNDHDHHQTILCQNDSKIEHDHHHHH